MTVHTIITVLTYSSDKKYAFDSKCLYGDLRKSICHAINRMGVLPENIYVLTDMNPKREVMNEMFHAYKQSVSEQFKSLGFTGDLPQSKNPKAWLSLAISRVAEQLNCTESEVSTHLNRNIFPKLSSRCVLEYTFLFCNLLYINTPGSYFHNLTRYVNRVQADDKLFFYYSGHGIRRNGKPYLQIPISAEQKDLVSVEQLQRLFSTLPKDSETLLVFDCCHAECFSTLKYKVPLPVTTAVATNKPLIQGRIVFVGSALVHQTCGFIKDNKNNEYCSAFSRFFFEQNWNGRFSLLENVDRIVNVYRKSIEKPEQNACLYLSDYRITRFFPWLSQTGEIKVREI